MTSAELRTAFLHFFEAEGHTVVPSSSLVPAHDPTLLFTNAGMVQFKDVFLGRESRPYRRATTAQKCVRAGGKHNDLDTVGRTARHHVFFEMLGNFSFGDYFKPVAIDLAWRFTTGVLGLPKERLFFSVFEDDDEASDLWHKVAEAGPERIARMGAEDNFWQMGDTGPCGPDSELWFDRGEACACGPDCHFPCGCGRFVEFWNLVFMQYDRDTNGTLTPLPRPSVDTGLGFERAVAILEGVPSNWDTDLFRPILERIAHLANRPYDPGEGGFPMRVIADHLRSAVFLIADGVLPANEGRGYVLRRILRRAVLMGRSLDLEGTFLPSLQGEVRAIMGGAYPEIVERGALIAGVLEAEEERFGRTLDEGSGILRRDLERLAPGATLSGERAFLLYDTYGFPIELTEEIASESGHPVDRGGFETHLDDQRRRARGARHEGYGEASPLAQATGDLPATDFLGYDELSGDAQVLWSGPADVPGTVGVVLDRTPFYGEGGGQVGDTGRLEAEGTHTDVVDTRRLSGGRILHLVKGTAPRVGSAVRAAVDEKRRRATARNHTATHLLQRALRMELGEHVHQAGSVVEPGRLRFDFTHFAAPSPDELRRVEDRVNGWILDDLPVRWTTMALAAARARGAMALFEEKYGDVVRVVSVEGVSEELCGGTHVARTGQIGMLKITQESSVASGVRRIGALTGAAVMDLLRRREALLETLSERLRVPQEDVLARLDDLERRSLEAEAALRSAQAADRGQILASAMARALKESGARLTAVQVPGAAVAELRGLADLWRQREGRGILAVVSPGKGRVDLLLAVSADLVREGFPSKAVFDAMARPVEGRGGGRGELLSGSGRRGEAAAQALEAALAAAREALSGLGGREGRATV